MARQNSETSARETDARRNGWAIFPLEEFVTEGLLHYVNREFFWPYGLALTVVAQRIGPGDRDFDWKSAGLRVTTTDPPEPIISGRDDADELLARAKDWMARRMDVADG